MFSKDVTIEGEILAKDWKVNMSKDVKLNTLLAQAGVKKDATTGALTTPLHFSTTYQHPEFGQSTGYDYTRTKNPTRVSLEDTLAAIESAD